MSPDAQLIAIARAHRTELYQVPIEWTETGEDDHAKAWCWVERRAGGRLLYTKLLDYIDDLNAMHEAEKTLTDDQAKKYFDCLNDVVARDECAMLGDPWLHRGALWALIHATVAQRAESFLRSLDLWDDTK